jgi:protein TonB
MKTRIAIAVAATLAACTTTSLNQSNVTPTPIVRAPHTEPATVGVSHNTSSMSLERYKRVLAQHIAEVNPDKIYPGNPQAMLRSVVVLKYVIDVNGKLIHSDTLRTNGDHVAVATALAALRNSAPFPPPPNHLLERGRMEILETMLFNDDGRFQMRSIAKSQLDE